MAKKFQTNQVNKADQRIKNPLVKRLYTLKEAAMYLGRSIWRLREVGNYGI